MRFVAPYHHYHSGEFWGTVVNLQYSVNTCSGAISDVEIEMALPSVATVKVFADWYDYHTQ